MVRYGGFGQLYMYGWCGWFGTVVIGLKLVCCVIPGVNVTYEELC